MSDTVIHLFTDGACRGNPGPGGWGALIRTGDQEKEMSGYESQTTNNRMEMMAVISGMESLKLASHVIIYTDSKYVKDGITQWIFNWQRNGWRTATKAPVKNVDLWQRLVAALKPHQVEWIWVKGHSGHPENERVDTLARQAIEKRVLYK